MKVPTFKLWPALSLGAALAVLATPGPCAGQADCADVQCPSGCACACTDCGYCNSGNFAVWCACCPDPGYTVCDVANGNCGLHQCNQCCTEYPDGQGSCYYNGCTGYSCPSGLAPQSSGLQGPVREVSFGPPRGSDLTCDDPAPQSDAPICDGCASRKVDLGPGAGAATAELLIPPDIPVDFPQIHLNFRNGGIEGGSFVLKNNSRAGLVTLFVEWKVWGDKSEPGPIISTGSLDSWASDHALLAPGAERKEDISFGVSVPKGHAVERVIGMVEYAEFDTGTRVGPEVDSIYPYLRRQREAILNAYHQLLGMIRSGLPDGQLQEYVERTHGIKWLLFVKAQKGWDGVAQELSKPRRLSL